MRGAGKRGQHRPHNPSGNPDVFQDVNVLAGDQVPGILDRLQAQEDARVRLEQSVGEMSQKLDQIAQFCLRAQKKIQISERRHRRRQPRRTLRSRAARLTTTAPTEIREKILLLTVQTTTTSKIRRRCRGSNFVCRFERNWGQTTTWSFRTSGPKWFPSS